MEILKFAKGSKTGEVVAQLGSISEGAQGIAIDNNNTIYVADKMNHRVLKFVEGNKSGVVVAGVMVKDQMLIS